MKNVIILITLFLCVSVVCGERDSPYLNPANVTANTTGIATNVTNIATNDANIKSTHTYLFTKIANSRDNLALSFDGINDRVLCGTDSSLKISSENITIDAWIKIDSYINGYNTVVSNYGSTTYGGYRFYVRSTHYLYFTYLNVEGTIITVLSDDTLTSPYEWNHVAVTMNNDTIIFYINGVYAGGDDKNLNIHQTITRPFEIGKDYQHNYWFNGKIDDVRVYNITLSTEQIVNNYISTTPVTTNGLVSWWKLNGNADDFIGNNHGTIYGSTWSFKLGTKQIEKDITTNYVDAQSTFTYIAINFINKDGSIPMTGTLEVGIITSTSGTSGIVISTNVDATGYTITATTFHAVGSGYLMNGNTAIDKHGAIYAHTPNAVAITVGTGAVGVNYIIRFDGEDSDGDIEWDHDSGPDGKFILNCDLELDGCMQINGSFSLGYEITTDSVTLTSSSGTLVFCNKATPMEIDLPAASGNAGLMFTIKQIGAGAVSIDANGGTIDGSDPLTQVDAQYDYVTIVSDGTNWSIIAEKEN